MRHLGMMNDKVTVEHTSLADRLRAAQLRQAGPEGKVIDVEPEDDYVLEDQEPSDVFLELPAMIAQDAVTVVAEAEAGMQAIMDKDDEARLQAALDEVLGFE
jgi:hypothetical protein